VRYAGDRAVRPMSLGRADADATVPDVPSGGRRAARGTTLLELLITIFISTLVASLILTSYRGMVVGFGRQARAAQRTQVLSRLKIRLDAAAADVDSVVAQYAGGLEYVSRSSGERRHLSYRNGRLCLDNDLLADSVTDVAWRLRRAESDSTVQVLFWEVSTAPAGWIGGAVVVP
jgi:type II secretory pathway pseudopilin PulG